MITDGGGFRAEHAETGMDHCFMNIMGQALLKCGEPEQISGPHAMSFFSYRDTAFISLEIHVNCCFFNSFSLLHLVIF